MDHLNKKLSSLTEISKEILKKILTNCPGKKYIIFEPNIIRPLERICGVKWLRENNVDKLFKFEAHMPRTFDDTTVHVYIIFSDIITFKQVLDQINSIIKTNHQNSVDIPKQRFHVVIIPSVLTIFDALLEELGLYDIVTLHSFLWLPILLDRNVLTLEISTSFKNLFVKNDYSILPVLAKCLWQLFCVTGKPNVLLGLGKHSSAVLKQLEIFNIELGNSSRLDSDFGAFIVMDRSTDYASALLTPVTYTGLLNEIYNIKCGVVESKQNCSEKYDEKFNPIIEKDVCSFALNSKDDLVYSSIRHRHFSDVTSILSELTKQLRTEGETSKELALDEMKNYVATQLQKLNTKKKNLANHLLTAETIVKILGHKFEKLQTTECAIIQNKNKSSNYWYLEETLTIENNKLTSLRLMCLLAMTQKLTYDELKNFKTKYLHEFGYKLLYVFHNLKTAGFFTQPTPTKLPSLGLIPNLGTNKNFYTAASKLKQIPSDPDKVNLKSPTCCSYVFGGIYIPLLIQIINMIIHDTPSQEVKNKLEIIGPLSLTKNAKCTSLQPKCIFVYVIGGVTYAEIAACNLLESLTGCKIIIGSECVVSGNNIMEAAL